MKARPPRLNPISGGIGHTRCNPVQRDDDRFNQFAGSVGQSHLRNRLFFFFSYKFAKRFGLDRVRLVRDAAVSCGCERSQRQTALRRKSPATRARASRLTLLSPRVC